MTWSGRASKDRGSPDIIHNRITRAVDYIVYNSVHGFNEQQHARAIVVMIFAFFNEEIRPRLARCKNIDPNEIKVDALGDLRLLRHAIIHNKGVLSRSAQAKLKVMKDLFAPDAEIVVSHDDMHSLFSALKQDVAVFGAPLYACEKRKNPPGHRARQCRHQ